jgi:hypothetical protein
MPKAVWRVRPAPLPSPDCAPAPPAIVITGVPENGHGELGHGEPGHGSDARPSPAEVRKPGGQGRVGTLRGGGVQIDGRRAVRVLVAVVLVTLAVLVVVFTVVGVHQNQQDDRLHNDGVPVTFEVGGCLGLLGGSGSNAAGYSCRGSYTLDGHRYDERLPGNDFHRPGSTVPAIAVPGDPALVSPTIMVDTEHSSAGVYVVPAILLVFLLLLVGLLIALRHRQQRNETGTGPATT